MTAYALIALFAVVCVCGEILHNSQRPTSLGTSAGSPKRGEAQRAACTCIVFDQDVAL